MAIEHYREYSPSIPSGMALFESGITMNGALRFRDISTPKGFEYGRTADDKNELVAYFQYEIDSLRMYADYLASVVEPRPVPTCPYCRRADAVLSHYAPTGQRRCVRCGRHYDTSNGEPKEVGR